MLHIKKKRLKSLVIKQKTVFQNFDMSELWPKNGVKNHFSTICKFYTSLLAMNQTFFYIMQNGFLLDYKWFKAPFFTYTTIFEKNYFWPLIVTFEVTALWVLSIYILKQLYNCRNWTNFDFSLISSNRANPYLNYNLFQFSERFVF